MAIGPAVPLDLVQPIERHIELVAAGKFEHQEIAVEVLDRETLEPAILRDAVLDVDDIVADVEVFQRREERGRFALGLRFVASAFGEELFFRQDPQPQLRREKSR